MESATTGNIELTSEEPGLASAGYLTPIFAEVSASRSRPSSPIYDNTERPRLSLPMYENDGADNNEPRYIVVEGEAPASDVPNPYDYTHKSEHRYYYILGFGNITAATLKRAGIASAVILIFMIIIFSLFGAVFIKINTMMEWKLNSGCRHPGGIAFSARLWAYQTTLERNQTVLFDKLEKNAGNVFNLTSGVFTAPVKGIYIFSMNICSNVTNDLNIVKNGRSLSRLMTVNGDDFTISSCLVNTEMDNGDEVWITCNSENSSILGNGLTTLSGYLIQPIC